MKKNILLVLCFVVQQANAQQFKLSYSPSASKEKFSGHVLLYLSKDNKSPKDAMVGLEQAAFFSVTVKDIAPGESITIDDKAVSFPATLSNIERGDY
jgi:hypothetical protein